MCGRRSLGWWGDRVPLLLSDGPFTACLLGNGKKTLALSQSGAITLLRAGAVLNRDWEHL